VASILIVEDAALSRQVLRRILQADGHTVLEAKNGVEGLEILKQHKPDGILLDMLMPEMGGKEFLQELRARNIKIPTIVITADIQETTRQECLTLGAIGVLYKLVKPDELRLWVKKFLDISS